MINSGSINNLNLSRGGVELRCLVWVARWFPALLKPFMLFLLSQCDKGVTFVSSFVFARCGGQRSEFCVTSRWSGNNPIKCGCTDLIKSWLDRCKCVSASWVCRKHIFVFWGQKGILPSLSCDRNLKRRLKFLFGLQTFPGKLLDLLLFVLLHTVWGMLLTEITVVRDDHLNSQLKGLRRWI